MIDVTSNEAIQARVNLVPLSPWIERASKAGVPFIPVEWGPWFPTKEWYAGIDGKVAASGSDLEKALDWWTAQRKRAIEGNEQIVFRWECSSGMRVKSVLAHGGTWLTDPRAFIDIFLDDPRAVDCNVMDPTRWGVRPWVEPVRFESYPLEIRVFHGSEGELGVSNYYPQRALIESGLVNASLNRARDHAYRLAERMTANATYHGFTADFLVDATPDHRVWLVDAGPPHVLGPVSAHPCCFAPGEIEGTALAPRIGALTY